MKKKITLVLATLACALVLVVGSIAGTIAYLTSTTDTVTNTFTVGNVKITLNEAKVTEYGVKDGDTRVTENTYKLIPGHTYIKDPTVHVEKGSEQCYVFVKVVDDIAAIQDATTLADQLTANGWTALSGVDNVYYYNTIVDARTADNHIDLKVFENFKILPDANVAVYANKTITVTAYAIQADGFDTAAAAWAAAPSNWSN